MSTQTPTAEFWQPLVRDTEIWTGVAADDAQREEVVRQLAQGKIAVQVSALPGAPETIFAGGQAAVFFQRTIDDREFIVPNRFVALVDFFLARARTASPRQANDQQQALAVLTEGKDLLVSGGPGTGKSHLIAEFLQQQTARGGQRPKRVVIAAPTGKAAARFAQVEKDRNLLLECSTIHRVLGIGNEQNRPRFHRLNPIACDILIIDEISMVELGLFAALIGALPPHAQILIAGDLNQLPAVGGLPIDHALALLTDQALISHARLSTVHRFSAEKASLYADIALRGATAAEHMTKNVTLHELGDFVRTYAKQHYQNAESDALRRRLKADLFDDSLGAQAVSDALRHNAKQVILTERREGPGSSAQINRRIRETLQMSTAADADTLAPIVATVNNYRLGIFNGDSGVLVAHSSGLFAVFLTAEGALRRLPAAELSGRDDAWALTIHKSQGSEYENVQVIIDGRNPTADYRLLYTAVTRAKAGATILKIV